MKHRKGAQDAKRSKIFQKISKEMQVAIQGGDNNPATNASLRLIIEKAKAANMPNDNIDRVLNKSKDAAALKEISFEGYGPNGVAILIECVTDNNNRTVSNVKAIMNKRGGNIGTNGSVSYLFETKGILVLDAEVYNEEEVMLAAMEMNILDVKEDSGSIIIETDPKAFIEVKTAMEAAGYTEFLSSEVTKLPSMTVALTDEQSEKLESLVEALEDDDDVSQVYTNVE